jgi:hypothetical protein
MVIDSFASPVRIEYNWSYGNGVNLWNATSWQSNANGFMFEVMRNLGFYIQFGETLGFVRWLRFEIDAGLGVQARIP